MNYDILVVGAGPAGLSFARLLADTGLRIALVDKQSRACLADPAFDGRDIALTHRSVRLLKKLGVWDRLTENERPPIRAARVLNGNSAYSLDFDVDDPSEALGYIVSNHLIRRALFETVAAHENLVVIPETEVTGVRTSASVATAHLSDGREATAKLLIAADSRFSATRRMMGLAADMHDFGRVCIVARFGHEKPHEDIAYECFHYGRTLAILPLTRHESSVVVTAQMMEQDAIMQSGDAAFSADIERRFSSRYGAMRVQSERFAYPLVGVHARRFCAMRFACIGDAAVGMHPVTAHGYNLGLSGADILSSEIRKALKEKKDFSDVPLLKRYERRHMRTTLPMFHGTNGIVRFFTDDRVPAKFARRLTLRFANRFPPIKNAIRKKLTS